MATAVTQRRLSANAVDVREESAGPPWSTLYWHVDGRLVSTGTFPRSRVFSLAAGQSLQVEVIDDTSAPEDAYSGQIWFEWYSVPNAVQYKVQEWDGAEWIDKRVIVSQGEEVFSHLTGVLDDGVYYQYRVLPVSDENIEGEALSFSFTVVRRPDAPATEIEYDPLTQRVTVSAA